MYRLFLLLLAGLLTTSCVANKNTDAMNQRLASQDQTIEEVRTNQANQYAEVEQLKVRIAQLEGRVQQLEQRFSPPPVNSLNTFVTPEPPIGSVDPNAQIAPNEAMELGADPNMMAMQDQPGLAIYNQARQQFEAGNYQAALAGWEQYVQTYPDSDLVSNAHFWQGECHFQLKDYPRAILSYQKVIENYPESPKYPTALLKQGVSFITIGKDQAGQLVLNDVINKFPNSPEAQKAIEFLRN